jgi:hypothetical protein
MKSAEDVQRDHEATWMALPHVIGVGLGEHDGKPALVIFASATHASHTEIPQVVEGYAVRIEVVGEVKAGE